MLMDQARQARDSGAMRPEQPQGEAGQASATEHPDWRQFTPPEVMDQVERVIAAGAKIMYSPDMRDEMRAAVQSQDPVPKKLAENVVGLLLTLDKQSQGGLPVAALFPAAMGLLGEASAVLEAAGQTVSQEEWNDAAMMVYTLIAKKMGANDEQIMDGVKSAMPAGQAEDEDARSAPPAAAGQQPSDVPGEAAREGEPVDQEEQEMQRGMA